jgi:DNA-binding MarR family transcriptional regulator
MKTGDFELFSNAVSNLIKSMQFLKSRKMAQYGLKGTTCLCLCQIYESEWGLTAGELSERGEIDKAQVSRCMAELTQKGFVYRENAEGRCYKQRYCLTPAGRRAAEDIVTAIARVQEAVRKDITDEEIEIFYGVLDTLCKNFTALLQTKRYF